MRNVCPLNIDGHAQGKDIDLELRIKKNKY